ncbi:MAG: hypothetical protein HQ565_12380 [Bacteroidetes bacterium]|nr:hypothetical protein [Bacteroidota bacterium]
MIRKHNRISMPITGHSPAYSTKNTGDIISIVRGNNKKACKAALFSLSIIDTATTYIRNTRSMMPVESNKLEYMESPGTLAITA